MHEIMKSRTLIHAINQVFTNFRREYKIIFQKFYKLKLNNSLIVFYNAYFF